MGAVAVMMLVPGGAAAGDASTHLSFTREDSDSPTRTAELTCDPIGGSHPTPAAACDYLLTADLALPEEDPGVRCFRYHPVTLRAQGTLRGQPISVEHTYNCLVPELPTPWTF